MATVTARHVWNFAVATLALHSQQPEYANDLEFSSQLMIISERGFHDILLVKKAFIELPSPASSHQHFKAHVYGKAKGIH